MWDSYDSEEVFFYHMIFLLGIIIAAIVPHQITIHLLYIMEILYEITLSCL